MALKATVFKAELQVSDLDRGHYGTHSLTVARHPSETDERMMVRILAYGLHAGEGLEFGRGLSTDDEPDLWVRDLTGAILVWIDVGLPDPRRLRKAAGRARRVQVLAYGGRSADVWWRQQSGELGRVDGLEILALPWEATQALAGLTQRNMRLQCTVQDGQIWMGDEASTVFLQPEIWLRGEAG